MKSITLKQYLENIQNFIKENPGALDFEVVYSADEEGNEFKPIQFLPTRGHFDGQDFVSQDELKHGEEAKAICIN